MGISLKVSLTVKFLLSRFIEFTATLNKNSTRPASEALKKIKKHFEHLVYYLPLSYCHSFLLRRFV